MNDDQTPSDEPTEVETTEIETTAEQPDAPDRWTSRLRGRGALAASGVGLVAISGLGGFALGHATAGDGGDSRFVRTDMPFENGHGPRPGDEGGFRGRMRGGDGTRPPEGGMPPNGSGQSDQRRQDDDNAQNS
jgi:hypothetical protein